MHTDTHDEEMTMAAKKSNAKQGRGRPSPIVTLGPIIVAAARKGISSRHAAAKAKISHNTVMAWKRRGALEADRLEAELTDQERIDEGLPSKIDEAPFADFYYQMEEARALAIEEMSEVVRDAAFGGNGFDKKDWKAAQYFLTHADPAYYSEKNKIELSGPEGGPIETSTTLSIADLAALVDRTSNIPTRDDNDDDDGDE